ncbi:MAG: TRAP transporter large permease subunit [Peptostreptococcaceae bacterium]|nr:TRAP transporter large permease subunit [Peptostreptococcaceae bacterium]
MIGMLTPPVGLVLFVLARALKIPVRIVIRGTVPFLLPLIFVAILVALVPQLSLWIPSMLK